MSPQWQRRQDLQADFYSELPHNMEVMLVRQMFNTAIRLGRLNDDGWHEQW